MYADLKNHHNQIVMQDIATYAAAMSEAALLHRQGRMEEADAYYRRAYKLLEGKDEADDDRRQVLQNRCRLNATLGCFQEASKLYSELRRLTEAAFGMHQPETALVFRQHALLLRELGHTTQAEMLEGLALGVWLRFLGKQPAPAQATGDELESLYGLKPSIPSADSIYEALKQKTGTAAADQTAFNLTMARALSEISALVALTGAAHTAIDVSRFALMHFEKLAVDYAWLTPDCLLEHNKQCLLLNRSEQSADVLLKYLHLFDQHFGDCNDLSVDLCNALASCYVQQQRFSEAAKCFDRAERILTHWSGSSNPRLIALLFEHADACLAFTDYQQAEKLLKQTIKLFAQLQHPRKQLLVDAHYKLGIVYARSGQLAEAEKSLYTGLQTTAGLIGPDSKDLPKFLSELGQVHLIQRRYAKALQTLERCFELQLIHYSEERPEVLNTRKLCATAYRHSGRYSDAELTIKRTIQVLERETGKSAAVELGWATADLGRIYRLQGQLIQADRTNKLALEIFEDVCGYSSLEACAVLCEQAKCCLSLWRFAQADKLCKRVCASVDNVQNDRAADLLVDAKCIQAQVRTIFADSAEAQQLLAEAVAIVRLHSDVAPETVLDALGKLAELYASLSRTEEAWQLCEEASLFVRGASRLQTLEDDLLYAISLEMKANCLLRANAFEQAIATFRKAISIRESCQGRTNVEVAVNLTKTALCHRRLEQMDMAEDFLFKSLQLLDRICPGNGILADTLVMQAAVMNSRHKADDAIALCKRALGIWELSPPAVSTDVLDAVRNMLVGARLIGAQDCVAAMSDIERDLSQHLA